MVFGPGETSGNNRIEGDNRQKENDSRFLARYGLIPPVTRLSRILGVKLKISRAFLQF